MLPPTSAPLLLPETWSIPTFFGTRLHACVVLHLLLQLLNAAVRHYQEVHRYVLYIFVLYGPVLWGIVAVYASVQGRVIAPATSQSSSSSSPVCLTLFGALVYVVWTLVFVALYGLFDKFEFDKTFTSGVDADELKTFSGLLANVFAQAAWLCVQLIGVHTLLPAYPSSATLLLGRCLPSLFIMEVYATIASLLLTIVGVNEFWTDDHTGIGVYMLCVYPVLFIQSARRVRSASDAEHPLAIWRQQGRKDTNASTRLPPKSTTTDDEVPTTSESVEDATETITEESKPELV